MCIQLRDKIRGCIYRQQRDRIQSTFIKFEEIDAQVLRHGLEE